MKTGQKLVAAVAALALIAPLSACGSGSLVSSASAIGAEGTGDGAYEITARIPSAAGLVQNAPVQMADATIGSVGDIQVADWQAKITIRLNRDVKIPEGSFAMIGMTSVLGSSHLEILQPEETDGKYLKPGQSLDAPNCPVQNNIAAPAGKAVPDINSAQEVQACRYPTTEQVLSSLSVVLNGGGLSQAGEIVSELSAAFAGGGDDLDRLIPRMTTLVTDLDKQADNIIKATEGLDRLSAQINAQEQTVQRALASGPQILQLLVDQRKNLVTSLESVGNLSKTANEILEANSDDLKVITPNMRELLDQLASTGPALTNSLRILLTFPFLQESIEDVVKGDYVNSDLVLDLTFDRLDKTMMVSMGLTGPEGLLGSSAGSARQSANPLTAPFGMDQKKPSKKTPSKTPSSKTPSSKSPTTSKSGGN
ncbi:MlaD family protein [Gordonia phosphorivorans]|uniref:MlaD family protein n=1 Tax=Gordonia phosphorivorans TaxID=1056982 RepID=A0ABV6H6X7_9ACTN